MRTAVLFALVALSASPLAACSKKSGSSSAGSGSASTSSSDAPGVAAPLTPGFEGDVTMHVTSVRATAPMDLVFHVKGPKARVEVPTKTEEKAHVIFDGTAQKTYVVSDAQRAYLMTDHALQKAYPGPRPLPAEIKQTGQHETVAGTDCEDWEITEMLGKHAKACVATGVAFFDLSTTAPPTGAPLRGWADELRMKQAFPLRVVETDSAGKELSRMEVTKVEKKSEDDAQFVLPAGYKAVPTVRIGDFPMPAMPR